MERQDHALTVDRYGRGGLDIGRRVDGSVGFVLSLDVSQLLSVCP
ncbi:MAG: hypothetical protein OES13_07155 [Acidimicrobiia bacterium]|nr:hypothetical protein [Acidimicrobiia bacterium]